MKNKIDYKEIVRGEIQQFFEERLHKKGLRMKKILSRGFFGDIYDKRTAYTVEDVGKLNSEGFSSEEGLGDWIFNLFFRL